MFDPYSSVDTVTLNLIVTLNLMTTLWQVLCIVQYLVLFGLLFGYCDNWNEWFTVTQIIIPSNIILMPDSSMVSVYCPVTDSLAMCTLLET